MLFLAGSAFAPPGQKDRTAGRTFNFFVPESYRDKIELGSEYGFEYEDGSTQSLRWHERQTGRKGRREWDRRGRRTRKQRATFFFGFEKIISNAHLLARHFDVSQNKILSRLRTVGADESKIEPLKREVVQAIESIVGKPYQSISRRRDSHSSLTDECSGYIIDGTYSDIAAGSGEIAIIRMVDVISSAPENSLVLIDEPESGIHQSSQERLLEFFIKHAIGRDLQFIFTTHSNVFLEVLTPDSIILLERSSSPGKIYAQHVNSSMALRQITDRRFPKLRAIVEDEFARKILNLIIEYDITVRDQVEIQAASTPGYQQILSTEFPALFLSYQSGEVGNLTPVLVLDGDCRHIPFDRVRQEFGDLAGLERELRRGRAYENVVQRLGTRLKCKRVNVRSISRHLGRAQDRYRREAEFIVRYVDHLNQYHTFLPGVDAPEVIIFEWLREKIIIEPNSSVAQIVLTMLPRDLQERFRSTFEEELPQNSRSSTAKTKLFDLQRYNPIIEAAFTTALTLWAQSSRDEIEELVRSLRKMLEELE